MTDNPAPTAHPMPRPDPGPAQKPGPGPSVRLDSGPTPRPTPRPAPGPAGAGAGALPALAGTSTTQPARRTVRVAVPDGWARAALAGIQAALIGWGLVMVLVLVGYLGVASNPWMGKATWQDAVGVGGDVWAASLGASVTVGGVSYRAVPTLVMVVLVLMARALMIPGRSFPAPAQWFAVPAFAVTALVAAASTASHVDVWHAVPGAVLVPAVAALWAVVQQAGSAPAWAARTRVVWDGMRQARVALVGSAVAGTVALVVSLHAMWTQVRGVHELLLAGSTTDTAVIVAAQALFAPSTVVWALSWLAGPGFWVGADTLHAPGTAPVAPIPAIPLLGALPTTAPGNRVAWIMVGVGVLVGVWVCWRHRAGRLADQAVAGAVCVGTVFALVAVAAWLSTMQLGTGRMAVLGPRVWWTAALVALEVGGVAQVVALGSHPGTVSWIRARVRAVLAWVRGRLGVAGIDEGGAVPPVTGADATPRGTAEQEHTPGDGTQDAPAPGDGTQEDTTSGGAASRATGRMAVHAVGSSTDPGDAPTERLDLGDAPVGPSDADPTEVP